MSSLTRPDVPSWRRHLDEEQERREDAVNALARQQARERLERIQAIIAVACLSLAAIVIAVVMS